MPAGTGNPARKARLAAARAANLAASAGTGTESGRAGKFRLPAGTDVRADILARYPDIGDILDIYVDTDGPVVHKWHHYLPIYDRYLSRHRGKPVRFLEIGVNKGGSLRMWRRYFGPEAIIFGIDIRKSCAEFDGIDGQVRIGSQADPEFLKSVVAEMGGVDLVLDDGSHRMEHIEASLDTLFPLLSDHGTYFIEDLHTAYWPRWGGGFRAESNFFNSVRGMVDDMHRWYHEGPTRRPALKGMVSGIHVHDSLVVLDKAPPLTPAHSYVGKGASDAGGDDE